MISQYKIQFKIIAAILIQAFLLLEISWAAPEIIRSASESTLAPAVNINQSDVQTVFSEQNTDRNIYENILKAENMPEDDTMVTMPSDSQAAKSPQADNLFTDISGADLLASVPPPENIALTVQLSNIVRNILPYPFTKKRLEEDVAKTGFELVSEVLLSRKQLVLLLETLEQENFVQRLKEVGVSSIEYIPAIVQDGRVTDTAVSTSEPEIISITDEFFKYKLAVRIFLIREAINKLTHDTKTVDYIDEVGNATMVTAKDLGLPMETDELIEAMEKIAFKYTFEPYWKGIERFVLYEPLRSAEFLRIPYTDNDGILALSVKIIPDLVKLRKTAPVLFTELIQSGLAHEGGKSGHMMKWPIIKDEILKYFNWNQLTKNAAEILIQALVNQQWPRDMVERGLPPFNVWTRSLHVIKESLKHFGYDRNEPEPYNVVWKEYAAYYGMVKERGLRSVAVWFWFTKYFRGLPVDYDLEFRQQYGFLSPQQRTQIIIEVEKIRKEYDNLTKPKSRLGSLLSGIFNTNLLSGVLTLAITAIPFAVWGATSTGVTVVNLSTAAFIFKTIIASPFIKIIVIATAIGGLITLLANITSLENRTARLFKRSINNNNFFKFRNFYDRSNSEEKVIIINTVLAMAQAQGKDKVISPEDTEQVYLWALADEAKEVRWTGAKAVREFAPYYGTAPYMLELEKYIEDPDSQVAISVAYAFKLYAGYAPEAIVSMLEGLEELETKMSASSVRTLESKTTSLFQKSIKKDDLAAFRSFFEESVAQEKVVIINKLLAMAQAQGKDKVISPEDTEQVYIWALDDTSKSVRHAGAKAVREFSPYSGSPYYRANLEKYLIHPDFYVSGSVAFALRRYGSTREEITALIGQLESQVGTEEQASKMEVVSKQFTASNTNGKSIGPEAAVDDKVSTRQRLLEPTRFIGQQDGLNTGLLKLIESAI